MTTNRRDFLKSASAAGLGALATSTGAGPLFVFGGSPNETMRTAVMGVNGRGMVFARSFSRGKNTAVAYLCDVDSAVLGKAMPATQGQATAAKAVTH